MIRQVPRFHNGFGLCMRCPHPWAQIKGTLVGILLFAVVVFANASSEIVCVGNQSLQVGVDRASGQIVELVDRASNQNLAGAATGFGGLWELEFKGGSPNRLSPTNARLCDVEKLEGDEPGLRLTWRKFGLSDAPDLSVTVTVRLDKKRALSRWRIGVDSPGKRVIARSRFPRVLNLPRLKAERLVIPIWAGLLARNPRQVFADASGGGVRHDCDYPGHCSMQCLAFYSDGGPGLYMASDDTAGYRKSFAVFSERQAGLNFEVVNPLPEHRATMTKHYVLPYSIVLGTFHGNWFDAATIYRAWATNQVWARESRWKRGLVPNWIADTALWVWNRGHATNVVDPAIALRRESGLPVSVFWHWWHGCAYDTGFPEYFPPRDGNAVFKSALDHAHAHDVHALVYMNSLLWGTTTASWTNENAALYAVKAADGQVKPQIFNTFTRLPCANMCMGTEFWRSKYAGMAAKAFDRLGVDGIYMDEACSSLECFDPRHGHPLGGGTYWINGFKTLAADIRLRCSARGKVALAGEGCAENWLPYLDLMLVLDVSRERYATPDGWTAIPFFDAVYHGYTVFFGNYSSLTMPPYDDLWPARFAPKKPLQLLDRKFSTQFYLEQARSFVWGQQLTIANFLPSQLRERSKEIAYVIRLAKCRKLALKYLQDGTMLLPPKVETPTEAIPMSRLSIYAGQQGGLKEFQKTVPLVLASAWRATDGRVAIAVASIADRPLTPTITLDAVKCGLPKRGHIYALEKSGARKLGMFHGKTFRLKPDLAPMDIHVFELAQIDP